MSQAATELSPAGSGVNETNDQNQFLTFKLANEIYAVGILNVREIIDYSDLTTVPMMPNFIRGVINLRGSVVPVVDIALRFNSKPAVITKRTSIIITELEDQGEVMDIGVIVDGVNEVLEIPTEDIEPPPSFGVKIRTDFIQGMGKVDGKFLVILDINKVLSVDELSVISDVKRSSTDGSDTVEQANQLPVAELETSNDGRDSASAGEPGDESQPGDSK